MTAAGGDSGHEGSGAALVSRRTLAIGTAIGTLLFGALIANGAREHGIGWGERGPETGYFPFRLGVVVMLASLATIADAFWRYRRGNPSALTRAEAARVVAFVLPMFGFVAATAVLGIYAGMILYLFTVMVVQGRYGVLLSAAVSVGAAVAFFVMFDKWLLVPLKKGPIEAFFNIH